MPFINQMVASFGDVPGSAGRYAGIIESALIVTEGASPFIEFHQTMV
jgi:hypothetical protein